MKESFEKLGFASKITVKGGALIDLGGTDETDALLEAHADTLRSSVGVIGSGVYAGHGYERSHIDGVYNTLKVLCGYLDV